MDVSAKGCAVIGNRRNQPPSRGWKSTVEPARAPREAFLLPRHDTSRLHLNAGGCFKVLTADFHPWLVCPAGAESCWLEGASRDRWREPEGTARRSREVKLTEAGNKPWTAGTRTGSEAARGR